MKDRIKRREKSAVEGSQIKFASNRKRKEIREYRVTCVIANAPSNIHNMRRMPCELKQKEKRE